METPFVDGMYDLVREALNEYEVIICWWPEYTPVLENAIADVEKAVIEALERQYGDVLTHLKDALAPKKFGLKYVQKWASLSNAGPYTVPDELGVLLNTMKRLLDILLPKVEVQFKSWASYVPDGGLTSFGEHLSEVMITLRSKFRNYMQAVVEKLAENITIVGVPWEVHFNCQARLEAMDGFYWNCYIEAQNEIEINRNNNHEWERLAEPSSKMNEQREPSPSLEK